MKRVVILLAIFLAFGFEFVVADIIHIPSDYPTIQEGIDASFGGDTLIMKT